MKITTGDNLNNYRNDVIDGYEKERQTEHRGEMLQGNPAYGEDGIFEKSILITRIEFANGLTFNQSFSAEKFDADTFFVGYGTYNEQNKVKALRVWSGNDHWLLNKESANKYLKVLPLNTNVSANMFFTLVYWTGTDDELATAVSTDKLDAVALLYHDGTSGGGGDTPVDTLIDFSNKPPTKSESEDKSGSVRFAESLSTNELEANDQIILPQSWEKIDHVYLKKAPTARKYSSAPDDRKLPIWNGILTIVYKDGETYDISTFTKFSYFYTFEELRKMNLPDIENITTAPAFDWEKTGGLNARHVPLLVVNPDDNDKKLRVLDSLDEDELGETRDQYTIEVCASTMFEPEMKDGFKLLSLPQVQDISNDDLVLKIDGMRVAQVNSNGINTAYYEADNGTLYIKDANLCEGETTLGNPDEKIERIVYGRLTDDSEEVEITTLSWPPIEPTPIGLLKETNASLPEPDTTTVTPEGTTEKDYSDEVVASTMMSAQAIGSGVNDTETVEETSIYRLRSSSPVVGKSIFKRLLASGKKLINRIKKIIDRIKKGVPKIISVIKEKTEKVKNFYSKVERVRKDISKYIKSANATEIEVPNDDYLLSMTSHYVPPIPQEARVEATNARLKWGRLFTQFYKPACRGVDCPNRRKSLSQLVQNAIKDSFRKITKYTLKSTNPNNFAKLLLSNPKGMVLVNNRLYESSGDSWVKSNIIPTCSDAIVTGFDEDSTADTMPVRIFTQGMQQTVVLHHPQAVSTNALIGLRCVTPPSTEVIGYGEQVNETTKDAGEWVGVDSNNQDVPLTLSHTVGLLNTPSTTLSISNGGVVALPIKWSSGVASGQVDMVVQATASAMQCFAKMGYQVSTHLLNATNSNGLISGIRRLVNKAREFIRKHPKITKYGKRALSWIAKQFKKKYPKLSKLQKALKTDSNGLPLVETEIVPDEEQTVVMNTQAEALVNADISNDQQVEDISRSDCLATYFEGNFPTGRMITLENIQKFFNDTRVALLFEKDEDLPAELGGEGVGTGFNRTYLEADEFVPPERLASDVLEFGTATITIRGIAFDLTNSLMNPKNPDYQNYSLVMQDAPIRTIYTFGEREMDLTGASWNLVDGNGNIVIDGLTKDNVFVDSLPINIEECMLEEPASESDKTQINVYFMGFVNKDIRVTLLHPYVVATKELSSGNGLSLATSLGIFSLALMLAPLAVSIWSRLRKKKKKSNGTLSDEYENVTTWPTASTETGKSAQKVLLEYLGSKIVLKDNFMRRKAYPVSEMSQTLFDKLFVVTGYDETSTDDSQEITITVMGNTTKKLITLADITYVSEEKVTDGVPEESAVSTVPPADWDGTTPESAEGMDVTLQPDNTTGILAMAHQVLLSANAPVYDYSGNLLNLHYAESTSEPSVFSKGKTEIGSLFASPVNAIVRRDSGLRFHAVGGIKKWFRKLKKKIQKIASKVVEVVKKVIGVTKKVVDTVKNVGEKVIEVGNTVVGAVGKVAGGGLPIPIGSTFMIESDLKGANGKYSLQPVHISLNATTVEQKFPWRGVKGLRRRVVVQNSDGTNDTKTRLCYAYATNKRILGMHLHRAPRTVPGFAQLGIMRRFPEVFPSGLAGERTALSAINDNEVQFDMLEMAGVTVYDPETNNLTEEDPLSGMVFYPNSACFSSQELLLGDVWPSVEEMKELVNLYVQRSDSTAPYEWVALPLSHSSITVDGYSNIDDNAEQFITVTLKTSTQTIVTHIVLHKTNSKLSLVTSDDQCYVWVIQHVTLDNAYIVYLAERRYADKRLTTINELGEVADVSYINSNPTVADQVKFLVVENRTVLSIGNYKDNADSMQLEDQKVDDKVTGVHGYLIQSAKDGTIYKYMLYGFALEEITEKACDDLIRVGVSDELYINNVFNTTSTSTTNNGILQYNDEYGGLVLFGRNHYIGNYVPKSSFTISTYYKINSALDAIEKLEG